MRIPQRQLSDLVYTYSALNSVSPQDAAIIAALRKEVEDLKSQIKQTKSSEVCDMGSCGM